MCISSLKVLPILWQHSRAFYEPYLLSWAIDRELNLLHPAHPNLLP